MPTVTAVSPTAVLVGNFSITVTGTKFVDGAKVMFGGQALTTKFVSSTQLTATGTTTASQKDATVQVTVTNPDPGSMASAGLMVKIGVPPTTVAITPTNVQLHPGETVQFRAVVSGTTNQAVTWEVNSVAGGNSKVGTISASGLYTAPSVAGNSSNPPAYVTLLSSLPLLAAVLPTPIPLGNFTISDSGRNFLNGAQVIFNGTMLPTTYISSTSLSASGTSAAAGTASLEVINPGAGDTVQRESDAAAERLRRRK